MKRFTDAGRMAIKEGNLYAALCIALTIPDICASLEYPAEKSKKRYEKWYKKWAESKFTSSSKIFVSAADCYQLRCSIIHSGTPEIAADKRDVLSRFVFFDQTAGAHLTWSEANSVDGVKQASFLQLKADLFSEAIFRAADEWDAATINDANVQKEKAKLFLVHTKGDTIGGIKFG